MNPKEKETLEKEIVLKCSGGQFQGKYICRNCGQAIRELDFDNNLEFDDDGKPKKTGFLPSTTLRGFLRRAIVTRNMREAKDNGNPYSLEKAYTELIGQDSESEKQAGDIDLLEIKKAREDSPVIDLFGSGLGVASRFHSKCSVCFGAT